MDTKETIDKLVAIADRNQLLRVWYDDEGNPINVKEIFLDYLTLNEKWERLQEVKDFDLDAWLDWDKDKQDYIAQREEIERLKKALRQIADYKEVNLNGVDAATLRYKAINALKDTP